MAGHAGTLLPNEGNGDCVQCRRFPVEFVKLPSRQEY